MKTKNTIFLFATLLTMSISVKSQISQYVLNFSDPTTYHTTCGSVNSAQWTVNSGTCTLYTPILTPSDTGSIETNYTIRINQKGNMSANDKLYFQIKISNNDWYTDTILLGNVSNNVRDISGSVELEYNDYVVFRFVAEINSAQGFWAIKSGDIVVNNVSRGGFLPVTYASFSGYNENASTFLQWTTFSEVNNDFFTLERSDDGKNFYKLSDIQGHGNSNEPINYEYTDIQSSSTQVTYYRLKQTDFDGAYEYSGTLAISSQNNETNDIWSYTENNTVYINYESAQSGNILLQVFDISGRNIDNQIFSAEKGVNSLKWTPKTKLNNGIYMLLFSDDKDNSQSLKVQL